MIAFQNARGISRGPTPADEAVGDMGEYGINIYGVARPNCACSDNLVAVVNASAMSEFGCGFILAASMPSEKRGYPQEEQYN